MADMDTYYLEDAELEARRLELAIQVATERARQMESRSLLNGKKQSVTSLRKHLEELTKDARDIREGFRGKGAEISEDVDQKKAAEVREAKDPVNAP